ncbi:UNKNOWN [Stylonychia lemnae]|uniref:Uncharacterized protein n=1 Tax=Stylonychia lemnae TaxID=5949 RepID=A0A078A9L9_STYLE|nr:UNKNOWN [Stylonychia lemnae]|eukprot:CDW78571.1 UNKNOWN [Stylonychia lemnae]
MLLELQMQHQIQLLIKPIQPQMLALTRYIGWAVKNIQIGVYRGLYKSSSYMANAKCMDRDSIDNMYFLYMSYLNNTLFNYTVFQSARDLLYYFIQHCEFDDMLNDISVFCSKNDCSIIQMSQNLMSNVIGLSTAIAEQAALIQGGQLPLITDEKAVSNFYQPIGNNLGKEIRFALNFVFRQY